MSKNALVSVIIPCYNNESYITETIQSVLDQDYATFEILVVNDGSSDKSEVVIYNIIEQHPTYKIKYLYQDNAGPSKARNNGAKLASGKYLLFLDGDDKIHPSYLSKCLEILENNNSINIVYSDAEYFDALSGHWKLPNYDFERLLHENSIHISAVIRTKIFNEVGGFDPNINFNEDWELWIRMTRYCNSVVKIKEPLFYYRKRANHSSLTDSHNNKIIAERSRLYIYTKHYELYRAIDYDFISLITST